VAAGLVDTGAASLATFVVGVSAFQLLDATELGVYALLFGAFVWLALLPTNVYLTPVEIALLRRDRHERLHAIGASLTRGLGLSLIAAMILIAATWAVAARAAADVSTEALTALTLTSAGVLVVSPLQDHLRRLFHLAARSELAAATSVVQLVAIAVALPIMVARSVGSAWIPMGALFVANTLSTTFAVLIAHRSAGGFRRHVLPDWRHLRRLGGWLVFQGGIQKGANLAASSILAIGGGLVAVGEVEGARVVAQPLLVMSLGLAASLGPRSMEAAGARNVGAAKHLRRIYLLWLLSVGLAYLVYAQLPGSVNIMRALVPAAYVSAGLVAIQLIASLLSSISAPYRSELLATGRERSLGLIELLAAILLLGTTAATVGVLGPYSVSVAAAAAASARWATRKVLADRMLKT